LTVQMIALAFNIYTAVEMADSNRILASHQLQLIAVSTPE